tara:strand:- start:3685 stop:4548 length:864 start_codon:yes stop_codon:yes gene_type:complete
MNLPITSRIKRSPLFKKNGKGPGDGATADGGSQEDDTVVKGESTVVVKPGAEVERQAETPEEIAAWKKAVENDPSIEDKYKSTETVVEGEDVVVPGKKIELDVPILKETKGTVMNSLQKRDSNRTTKKANKDVRRSKIKLSRYGTQGDDGEWKMNANLNPRQRAKFEENQQELKDLSQSSKQQSQAVKSGGIAGQSFQGDDIAVTKGERSETQQVEQARREAQNDMAGKNDITTASSGGFSQSAGSVDVNSNDTGFVPYTTGDVGKKMSESPAKKSPYKMKGHPGKR